MGKINKAIYEVKIGMKTKDVDTDNYMSVRCIARTALEAADDIQLDKGEYISQVILIARADW